MTEPTPTHRKAPAPPTLPQLGTQAFQNDPAAAIRSIHADRETRIYQHPFGPELVVTAYEDLQGVLKHPRMQAQDRQDRSSGPSQAGALAQLFDHHPVFMNEPQHRPTRLAATAAIGVDRREWIDIQVRKVSEELIGDLRKNGGGDLVSDFAFALSSRLWCRILAIPETEAPVLQECARGIAGVLEFQASPTAVDAADEAAATLSTVLKNTRGRKSSTPVAESLVAEKLQTLADRETLDNPRDLLASLTFDAVDGAGGMTGNFLYCLLTEPEALSRLKDSTTEIGAYWTESARLHPPLLGLFRCPTEDLSFDGFALAKGQNVLTLNAAGNRDPQVFARPDAYEPHRPQNRPLSFGFGSRGCIGRFLASREGEIAVAMLLSTLPGLELTSSEFHWGRPSLLRAVQSLPVAVN